MVFLSAVRAMNKLVQKFEVMNVAQDVQVVVSMEKFTTSVKMTLDTLLRGAVKNQIKHFLFLVVLQEKNKYKIMLKTN